MVNIIKNITSTFKSLRKVIKAMELKKVPGWACWWQTELVSTGLQECGEVWLLLLRPWAALTAPAVPGASGHLTVSPWPPSPLHAWKCVNKPQLFPSRFVVCRAFAFSRQQFMFYVDCCLLRFFINSHIFLFACWVLWPAFTFEGGGVIKASSKNSLIPWSFLLLSNKSDFFTATAL